MSNPTRRRSRNLRLVLASLALLGIGAAVTAAAWEDIVYVDVDVSSGSMDLEGSVDGGTTWLQSEDENNITLAFELTGLTPGDERSAEFQLRNSGDMTAYLTVNGTGTLTLDLPTECPLTVDADAFPTEVPGEATVSWTVDVTVPTNWPDDCQDVEFATGYVAINATTDVPTP